MSVFLSVSSIPDTSHSTANTLILPALDAALNTNTSKVSALATIVLAVAVGAENPVALVSPSTYLSTSPPVIPNQELLKKIMQ